MTKSLNPRRVRLTLGLTQRQLATKLDVTSEYVSMMENNKKPVSKKMLKKFKLLLDEHNTRKAVCESSPPSYQSSASGCRYPPDYDVIGEIAAIKASITDMQGKINTLLGLLGAPLRKAIADDQDDDRRDTG